MMILKILKAWNMMKAADQLMWCAMACYALPAQAPSSAGINQRDPPIRLRNVRPQTIFVREIDQLQHL